LRLLNHPLISATGNAVFLITAGPVVLAAVLAAVGFLAAEPILLAAALVLFVLDALLMIALWRRRPTKPTGQDSNGSDRSVFLAVEAEVALAHEEALEMIKLLRAEWPHITVEGALVQTALPDWRAKTCDFIGITLGSAQRAAFKASAAGPNELERLGSEGRFLGRLALGLTENSIRVSEAEFLAARSARRAHEVAGLLHYEDFRVAGAPPVDLRRRIDELMIRGIDVVDELSKSVIPQETGSGVWMISGGDAPDEWWEKADEVFQEARSLLKCHQPALLKDFEEGVNRKLRSTELSSSVDPTRDRRTDPEKMLALADAERSNPRLIVEATLDGLTEARRRLGS